MIAYAARISLLVGVMASGLAGGRRDHAARPFPEGEAVRRGGPLSRGHATFDHVRRDPANLSAPLIVYATLLIPLAIVFVASYPSSVWE